MLLFLFLAPRVKTYNAALALCLLIALCLTGAFFLLRGRRQKRQAAAEQKQQQTQAALQTLQMAAETDFIAWLIGAFANKESTILHPTDGLLFFPRDKRALVWHRGTGPGAADRLLPALRSAQALQAQSILVCAVNALPPEAIPPLRIPVEYCCGEALLTRLRQSGAEIPLTETAPLPPLKKRVHSFLLRKETPRKCLRYSALLFAIAFLTPFRLYYWCVSALLAILAVCLKWRAYRRSKKIF